MSILNRSKAKILWKMFYRKFPHPNGKETLILHFPNELTSFKNVNFFDSLMDDEESDKDKKENRPKEVQSHSKRQHKNICQEKLKNLLNSLQKGDWYHQIFQDNSVSELAFTLFKNKIISYQQYCSVILRSQFKHMKEILVFPIVDEHGNFTAEGETILWPNLRDHYFLLPPTEEQITELKLLIATLPISEQFFFCSADSLHLERNPYQHKKPLDPSLSAYIDSQRIHLTAGLKDALGLVRYGVENYEPPQEVIIMNANKLSAVA